MTKSIRIKNSNGDKATIWPVGEFHYSVKWDYNQETYAIAKHYVDGYLFNGDWEEIKSDELPDTFKFTIVNDSYTATKEYDIYVVSWGASYAASYTIPEVKKHLESGNWKIIEEGRTESMTYHQEETDILQTIKQFVEEFDAQVVTCKEGYLVYSDNYTIEPYRANSDEELKEILQAIRVLKKYEGV